MFHKLGFHSKNATSCIVGKFTWKFFLSVFNLVFRTFIRFDILLFRALGLGGPL